VLCCLPQNAFDACLKRLQPINLKTSIFARVHADTHAHADVASGAQYTKIRFRSNNISTAHPMEFLEQGGEEQRDAPIIGQNIWAKFNLQRFLSLLLLNIVCTMWAPICLIEITFSKKWGIFSFIFQVAIICLIIMLIVCGSMLFHFANEDSVSGMVAQRYSKLSYFVILALAGSAFFVSAFILHSASIHAVFFPPSAGDVLFSLLGAFSPVCSVLILIFPLVVIKTDRELYMVPLDVLANLGSENANTPTLPSAWTQKDGVKIERYLARRKELHATLQNSGCICAPTKKTEFAYENADTDETWAEFFQQYRPSYFTMKFYSSLSRKWHSFLHFLVIALGVLMGYAYIVHFIVVEVLSARVTHHLIILICFSCFAFLCLSVFLLLSCRFSSADSSVFALPSAWMRPKIFIEFLGLYYFFFAILYTASQQVPNN
jgi:hypothetical protein